LLYMTVTAVSPSPEMTRARTDTDGVDGAGSTVARFAGDTVAQRLAAGDLFKARDYEAALKRAFLATDEDLRASASLAGVPGRELWLTRCS
jgi:hypothetical protein